MANEFIFVREITFSLLVYNFPIPAQPGEKSLIYLNFLSTNIIVLPLIGFMVLILKIKKSQLIIITQFKFTGDCHYNEDKG